MHKRTQEEIFFGRWLVVVNGEFERFYHEKDAEEFKNFCIDNGFSAYVNYLSSDTEDDNFPYYFE